MQLGLLHSEVCTASQFPVQSEALRPLESREPSRAGAEAEDWEQRAAGPAPRAGSQRGWSFNVVFAAKVFGTLWRAATDAEALLRSECTRTHNAA